MQTISIAVLVHMSGGVGDTIALGRCGPSDRWNWLGDVYTPACLSHDLAVRKARDNGDSKVMSHLKALPLLPAAVESYIEKLVRDRG